MPERHPNARSLTARWTERDLLDRLRARHDKTGGNGPEWVYMEHVRSSAGMDCLATIDALAMHLWRSRHHEVHAYEVKVSRGDFRRELADEQAKSAIWRAWVDHFWIVAPASVVPLDELPDRWGLLETRGTGLAVRRPARRLQPRPAGYMAAPDLPRDVVAPMLRAAVRTSRRDAETEATA